MKKLINLIIILGLYQSLCFGQTNDSSDSSANQINIVVRDQLLSKTLGEERALFLIEH